MYIISESFIQWAFAMAMASLSGVRRKFCTGRFREKQNNPPNCPPTSVLLVLKLKFYKIICFVLMEIAETPSFGTRKSQVQILPPRPPSNKIGGTEYYRYEFWVGSWVGGFGGPELALPVNSGEYGRGIRFVLVCPPGRHAGVGRSGHGFEPRT